MERNGTSYRISLGVNDVHGEAQLEACLRDQGGSVWSNKAQERSLSRYNLRKKPICMTVVAHTAYRPAAILLNHRTLALVIDTIMMQGLSDKQNNPDNLLAKDGPL